MAKKNPFDEAPPKTATAPTAKRGSNPFDDGPSASGGDTGKKKAPSTGEQIGHAIKGIPSGLFHLGGAAVTELRHTGETNRGTLVMTPKGKARVLPAPKTKPGETTKEYLNRTHPLTQGFVESGGRTAGDIRHPTHFARASQEGTIVGKVLEDTANISLLAGAGAKALAPAAEARTAAAAEAASRAEQAAKLAADARAHAQFVRGAAERGVASEGAAGGAASEAASLAQEARAAQTAAERSAAAARASAVVRGHALAHSVSKLGEQGAALPAKPYEYALRGAGRIGEAVTTVATRNERLAPLTDRLQTGAAEWAKHFRVDKTSKEAAPLYAQAGQDLADYYERIANASRAAEKVLQTPEEAQAMHLLGTAEAAPGGGLDTILAGAPKARVADLIETVFEGRGEVPSPEAVRLATAVRRGEAPAEVAGRMGEALNLTREQLRAVREGEEMAGKGRAAPMPAEQTGTEALTGPVADVRERFAPRIAKATRATERAGADVAATSGRRLVDDTQLADLGAAVREGQARALHLARRAVNEDPEAARLAAGVRPGVAISDDELTSALADSLSRNLRRPGNAARVEAADLRQAQRRAKAAGIAPHLVETGLAGHAAAVERILAGEAPERVPTVALGALRGVESAARREALAGKAETEAERFGRAAGQARADAISAKLRAESTTMPPGRVRPGTTAPLERAVARATRAEDRAAPILGAADAARERIATAAREAAHKVIESAKGTLFSFVRNEPVVDGPVLRRAIQAEAKAARDVTRRELADLEGQVARLDLPVQIPVPGSANWDAFNQLADAVGGRRKLANFTVDGERLFARNAPNHIDTLVDQWGAASRDAAEAASRGEAISDPLSRLAEHMRSITDMRASMRGRLVEDLDAEVNRRAAGLQRELSPLAADDELRPYMASVHDALVDMKRAGEAVTDADFGDIFDAPVQRDLAETGAGWLVPWKTVVEAKLGRLGDLQERRLGIPSPEKAAAQAVAHAEERASGAAAATGLHKGFVGPEETFISNLEPPPEGHVRLYRGTAREAGTGAPARFTHTDQLAAELNGRFFTTDPWEAASYARSVAQPGNPFLAEEHQARGALEPALTYVDVPESDLGRYHVGSMAEAERQRLGHVAHNPSAPYDSRREYLLPREHLAAQHEFAYETPNLNERFALGRLEGRGADAGAAAPVPAARPTLTRNERTIAQGRRAEEAVAAARQRVEARRGEVTAKVADTGRRYGIKQGERIGKASQKAKLLENLAKNRETAAARYRAGDLSVAEARANALAPIAGKLLTEGKRIGERESRYSQAVRVFGLEQRRLERLQQAERDAVAKVAESAAAAPARYRPVIESNRRAQAALNGLADEMDKGVPASGGYLRDAAAGIPVTLEALVDADVDPEHFIGGMPKGSGPRQAPTSEGGAPRIVRLRSERKRAERETTRSIRGQASLEAERAHKVVSNVLAENLGSRFGKRLGDFAGEDLAAKRAAAADADMVAWDPHNPFGTPAHITEDSVFLPRQLKTGHNRYFGPPSVGEHVARVVFDIPHRAFRHSVLALTPAWHVGNMVGNAAMATLGGGINPAELPGLLVEAKRALAAGEIPSRILRTGPSFEDIAYLRQQGKVPRTLVGRAIEKSYRFNQTIDDMTHSAVYLNAKAKGFTEETAVREALKVAGDFTKLNEFERRVLRRAVPFYTWQRHITQLAFHLAVEHPLRVAWTLHLANTFGDDQSELPGWLQGSIAIGGGKFVRLGGLNPYRDIGVALTPHGVARGLSPVLKTGAGLAGVNLERVGEKGRSGAPFTAPRGFEGKRPSLGRMLTHNFLRQGDIVEKGVGAAKGQPSYAHYDTHDRVVVGGKPVTDENGFRTQLYRYLGIPTITKPQLDELRKQQAKRAKTTARSRQRYRRRAAG